MKRFNIIGALALLICTGSYLFAQTDLDAYRYSRILPYGSSRMMGTGGAMGAIGADMSCLSTNPAGIGLMRRSDFSFGLGLNLNNSKTAFNGQGNYKDNATTMTIPQGGLVIAFPSNNFDSKFKGGAFGVTYNRIADFNQDISYEGESAGSMITSFNQAAQGKTPTNLDPFYEQMAYGGYLIDNEYQINQTTYDALVSDNVRTKKKDNVSRRGGMSELNIGFGLNIDHRVYFGLGLNLGFMTYESNRRYREEGVSGSSADRLNYFEFTENIKTKNTGTNRDQGDEDASIGLSGNLGIIVKATNNLRFGLSYRTPTRWKLQDTWRNGLNSSVIYQRQGASAPETLTYDTLTPVAGPWTYTLITPGIVTLSSGYVFGKNGFINAEVDYMDYSNAEFDFGQLDGAQVRNNAISNKYQGVVNARIGGEYAYDIFRVRAGYGYYGNPIRKEISIADETMHTVSLGAGMRFNSFYIDLGAMHMIRQEGSAPYVVTQANINTAVSNIRNTRLTLTLGWKFGGID